ncbi:MAG TPA: hypothetical protein VM513_30435 [Kofleriaceae bacterium]|nr:hypothetical protein [Kofleriaceae bacterium]
MAALDELRAFDEMFRVARDAVSPLRETAGAELVELYARVAHPAQARAFFDRVDPRLTRQRLQQLANAYVRHDKRADAAIVRAQLTG